MNNFRKAQSRSTGKPFNLQDVKDPDLRAYVQHLSDSLSRQNQDLKILNQTNKIFQIFFETNNLKEMLDGIAGDIQFPGTNSLRILIHRKTSLEGEENYAAKNGEFAQEFSYLDEQIIDQLKDKNQLNIPDTSRIHSIKFSPDKKFPKAIAAYRFLDSEESSGYFWVAYESDREFTDFEQNIFSQISTCLNKVCILCISRQEMENRSKAYTQILNFIDLPVILMNQEMDILFVNPSSKKLLDGNCEILRENKEVIEFVNSIEVNISKEIEINGQMMQLDCQKIYLNGKITLNLLVLSDETITSRKREYLSLVMDLFSHDFRVPLINMQGYAKMLPNIGDLNEKQNEYLEMINNGLEETLSGVDDLFDLERISQEERLKISGISSREMIDKAISLVHADARQKRISIETALSDEPNILLIDKGIVLSAIYNLLTNAVVQSRLGGREKRCQLLGNYRQGLW
jgi:hypothetical protein